MKVFISWSGNRSHAVALLLHDWIKCVIQATQPWISSRDIDRGALWFNEINDQLKEITVGIICLTQENKNRPWILFEAGALAKGLSASRVCTLLIDLKPEDMEDPLAQFNHTFPTRDSMLKFIRTLNSCLPVGRLDERIVEQVFATYWSQFDEKFKAALKDNPSSGNVEPRAESNILAEILENTRHLNARMRSLEFETSDRFKGSTPDIEDILNSNTSPDRPPPMDPDQAREEVRRLRRRGNSSLSIARRLAQFGVPASYVESLLNEPDRKPSVP